MPARAPMPKGRPTVSTGRKTNRHRHWRGQSAPPPRGGPGGVYLDLTAEVLGSALRCRDGERKSLVERSSIRRPAQTSGARSRSRRRAIELLANAQRPLVILGQGCRLCAGRTREIRSFIETTGIPFLANVRWPRACCPTTIRNRRQPLRSYCGRQTPMVGDIGRGAPQLAPIATAGRRYGPRRRGLCRSNISPTEFDSNRGDLAAHRSSATSKSAFRGVQRRD